MGGTRAHGAQTALGRRYFQCLCFLPTPLCCKSGSVTPHGFSGPGRGRSDPKVGYTGSIKLRNNAAFVRGVRWPDRSSPSLTSCQGLLDSGWEKNQIWKMTPQKIYFPCDLNDNSSHPASWLDWETSFSPCYPIIQTTHVCLKWSLLYISCQPRYTFNSKEGVNWQRCKTIFLLFQFLSKISSTRKMLVVSDLFCL